MTETITWIDVKEKSNPEKGGKYLVMTQAGVHEYEWDLCEHHARPTPKWRHYHRLPWWPPTHWAEMPKGPPAAYEAGREQGQQEARR